MFRFIKNERLFLHKEIRGQVNCWGVCILLRNQHTFNRLLTLNLKVISYAAITINCNACHSSRHFHRLTRNWGFTVPRRLIWYNHRQEIMLCLLLAELTEMHCRVYSVPWWQFFKENPKGSMSTLLFISQKKHYRLYLVLILSQRPREHERKR